MGHAVSAVCQVMARSPERRCYPPDTLPTQVEVTVNHLQLTCCLSLLPKEREGGGAPMWKQYPFVMSATGRSEVRIWDVSKSSVKYTLKVMFERNCRVLKTYFQTEPPSTGQKLSPQQPECMSKSQSVLKSEADLTGSQRQRPNHSSAA